MIFSILLARVSSRPPRRRHRTVHRHTPGRRRSVGRDDFSVPPYFSTPKPKRAGAPRGVGEPGGDVGRRELLGGADSGVRTDSTATAAPASVAARYIGLLLGQTESSLPFLIPSAVYYQFVTVSFSCAIINSEKLSNRYFFF
jgi:hypothetical protein